MQFRIGELADLLFDDSSFSPFEDSQKSANVTRSWWSASYCGELVEAKVRSGMQESAVAGTASIDGHGVVGIFTVEDFLAGTLGATSIDTIIEAIQRATKDRMPVVCTLSSGGIRMQEGTPAFARLVDLVASISRHKDAGLVFIVYLRHATTGGCLASVGSLGHVTMASAETLIALTGPRVFETVSGAPFPADVQVASNLAKHGLIDILVTDATFRSAAGGILDILHSEPEAMQALRDGPVDSRFRSRQSTSRPTGSAISSVSGWESVLRTRRIGRPGLIELVGEISDSIVWLERESVGLGSVKLGLAKIGTFACVVVGTDRSIDDGAVSALGMRAARRGIALAQSLTIPLVTVVDTSGALLTAESEEAGLAREIGNCIADMVNTDVPCVSLFLGQGAGGPALALMSADAVLCAEFAWLAPIAPEAASAIRFRDSSHADEMADGQLIRSGDLLRLGIVDHVIDEGKSDADMGNFLCESGRAIQSALSWLSGLESDERMSRRLARYRRWGEWLA
jgi:acyl-CoA carboxylase subunit beta